MFSVIPQNFNRENRKFWLHILTGSFITGTSENFERTLFCGANRLENSIKQFFVVYSSCGSMIF